VKNKKTIFMTGAAGYIAGVLLRRLESVEWCGRVYGMDRRPPGGRFQIPIEFREMDINDAALIEWVREIKPDIFIHMAFIVDPIHDEELMSRVNIGGTKNALEAASGVGAGQIMIASSGVAYGAWPDNPTPLKESHPLRPHPAFRYANDKSRIDSLCQDFAREHPDRTVSVIRPCVVYGPGVDNYLSNLLTGLPWLTGLAGYNPPMQFVHEEDVAGAIIAILEKGAAGAFNIAPPDTVTVRDAAAIAGKPSIFLPIWILEPMVALAWHMRLPLLKAPPSLLDFMKYPWVLDSARLREEIGYSFRYSSRETLEILLREKGVLR